MIWMDLKGKANGLEKEKFQLCIAAVGFELAHQPPQLYSPLPVKTSFNICFLLVLIVQLNPDRYNTRYAYFTNGEN